MGAASVVVSERQTWKLRGSGRGEGFVFVDSVGGGVVDAHRLEDAYRPGGGRFSLLASDFVGAYVVWVEEPTAPPRDRDDSTLAEFVPLSVREGGSRERLSWRLKGVRERVALRLAPWLVGPGG